MKPLSLVESVSRKPIRESLHTATSTSSMRGWVSSVRSAAMPGWRRCSSRIQRDLFAIGARLADPGSKVAHRVAKTAVTGDDVKRLEDWIDLLESEVPALRRFILAGGSRAGASLHVARTICRRAERDGRQARHRARRARDPRVLEPPVRSAVRHGASREPTGRRARIRVVSHDRSDGSRLRGVRAARARALRELSRWRRASCPAAMRPHIAAIYAFARTADDYADEPGIANGRAPAPARRLGPAARRGGIRP